MSTDKLQKHNVLFASILFAVSLALGFLVAPHLTTDMLQGLEEMLGPIASLGAVALFLVIFLNNAIKALAVIVLGIAFGLPPFIFISFNGFIVGMLVSGFKSITGYGIILAALLPHGVIEVPLIVLATALGFAVGRESIKWLTGRESNVRSQLRRGLRIYFKWILLGLLIAAAIEAFITPLIVGMAGGNEFLVP